MRLLIGSLIHDREEITACYLRHLGALDLSGIEVSWLFVCDNPGTMPTPDYLCRLPSGAKCVHIMDDVGVRADHWEREAREGGHPRPEFRRLAWMRNMLRGRAIMEQVDGLVSIDSDICAPPDLVQRLAAADRPWVSALVDNSARINREDPELARMRGEKENGGRRVYNVSDLDEEGEIIRLAPDLEAGGECDATGAVCLYRRDLLEAVSWRWHGAGEDIGLANAAKAAGFRGHYLPEICDHLMTEARLAAHKETCALCR